LIGPYLMPVKAAIPASTVITAANETWATSEPATADSKPMPITGNELPANSAIR
jgi:hypothetical protein